MEQEIYLITLKTMLVKYKQGRIKGKYDYISTLKTMLVKYKSDLADNFDTAATAFKNNAC